MKGESMTPLAILIVTAIVGLALGATAAMIVSEFRKREPSLTSEEIDRTAVHEAGHAVCNVIYGFKLWRVEIFPKGRNVYGRCSPSRSGWMRIPISKWREYARVGCAGYAAERLFYGTVDKEYVEDDFESASRLIAEHGKGVSIEAVCGETISVLKQHGTAIRAVADELLRIKSVSGQRVKDIIDETQRAGERANTHRL
jgi:hypothetical protein